MSGAGLAVAGLLIGLSGCGGGSSSTSAVQAEPKSAAPKGASDCVSAWNAQEGESRVEGTFFPVSEGELEAWISIYEGRSVGHEIPVSGSVEGVMSGDCLVVLGDTDEEGPVVWSYEQQSESGFWSLAEEGAGGPLYEFGRNSQAATRGEILKGGKLRLADGAEAAKPPKRRRRAKGLRHLVVASMPGTERTTWASRRSLAVFSSITTPTPTPGWRSPSTKERNSKAPSVQPNLGLT
jgi:hypothetical protein